ncbi:MAG: anti-sigma F factor antagonist [Defluviitaleaceae bacterium]|nr:anti-sigma F factor antagonist [Defluviitaleaceae bacterium]
MNINFEYINRNLIVKISGDIDHHTSEEIREKIEREYKRENAKNIVFDFSHVNFMDSSGIGMIIGRYKTTEQAGGKVFVRAMSENVERIFNISGLHKIIEVVKA